MDNKLKIGLLVDDSDNIFTTEIWRGASYAAGKLDVNLVVFFGGFVGSSNIYGNSRYEFQKNTTYKFSKTKDLDLLIISVSSIVHGNNRLKELFVKEFEGVPIVTLNHKFGNNSLVTFDNAKGIEDAVTSLIQEQQCRKIGMIAGPYENKGSDERLAAYKKTLKSHGIVIDEKRIIHTATFERGCDLKYRDFVDLDFVSSQLGTVVNTINLVEKLDNLSKHDELTGLWNRRGFIDKVQGYMNINKGALIFVDLDGLKIINDTYGHEGGDEAIITGAKILKDAFDEFGVIGRIGGDEFAVFLPNQSDFALSEIDQLINDKTIYHNTLIKRNFKVELSYGISLFDQYQDLTVRELLDKADREMYCHKRNKKGNRRKKDVF